MTHTKNNFGEVKLTQHGAVAQLILSRPNALNAITWEMYGQLEDYLEKLASDPNVHVLVIRGDGEKAFAAGTDISHFQNFTGEDGVNYERRVDKIMTMLENFPKPTIAAIQGFAIGGGMLITTVCDLRYATKNAKFGAPIAKSLGNCLSIDNIQRVSNAIGAMKTKELLFTAKLLPADKAHALGYVTDILETEGFHEQVLEIATGIGENAPLTIGATKKAFQLLNDKDVLNSTQEFEKVISQVYGSEDFAEGVEAYLTKRSPVWEGK